MTSELIYLEPDDEITVVVRRIRASSASRVVLVTSGRSKATSSSIALRLLARVATDESKSVVLVADAGARALAAEAGIDAFASIAESEMEGAVPVAAPGPHRASIRVVRDDPQPPPVPLSPLRSDETQAVPVVRPEPTPPTPRWRPSGSRMPPPSRRLLLSLSAVAIIAIAALAAVLPSAAIEIVPAAELIGPVHYVLEPEVQGPDEVTMQASRQGSASGVRDELIPAVGTVTFYNWGLQTTVPAGTAVSAGGEIMFTTDAAVSVPQGAFNADGRLVAGEASIGITAAEGGVPGNVAANVIDTVEDRAVAIALRGPFQLNQRLVINADPTSGGTAISHPVIEQADVDAVVAAIEGDLQAQINARLAANPAWVFPVVAGGPGAPDVPGDLVGTEDQATFELSGTYQFSRGYVLKDDIETEAAAALAADTAAVPAGMTVVFDSIEVSWEDAQQVGGTIRVPVTVSARATAEVDLGAIRQQVLGMTSDEAQAALAELGTVHVQLWPGWVDRIPRLDWRVSVTQVTE